MNQSLKRCGWCGDDPLYQAYHDREWGRPLRDRQALFELLCLEGQQAGLSWITVLRKRENYRAAFSGFDIATVADMHDGEISGLMKNPGLIRQQRKLLAIRNNARAVLAMEKSGENFVDFLWGFVGGTPRQNRFRSLDQLPAFTDVSTAMSKALKKRGFSFVGPTICYAFMQSAGLVNDHLVSCFVYEDVYRGKGRPD